jgi:hypothetical protein
LATVPHPFRLPADLFSIARKTFCGSELVGSRRKIFRNLLQKSYLHQKAVKVDIETQGFPGAKLQRAGALQDAARGPVVVGQRVSVLDCGGPPPLFRRQTLVPRLLEKPRLQIFCSQTTEPKQMKHY